MAIPAVTGSAPSDQARMEHAQDDKAVESLFLENLPAYVEEKIASNQDAVKGLIR